MNFCQNLQLRLAPFDYSDNKESEVIKVEFEKKRDRILADPPEADKHRGSNSGK